MMNSKTWWDVILIGLLLGLVQTARAETLTWVGGATGDWNTPSNWSDDAIPGAGDQVSISTQSLVQIGAGTAQAASVEVGGADAYPAATLQIWAGATLEIGGGTGVLNLGTESITWGRLVIGANPSDLPDSAGILGASLVQFGNGYGDLVFNHIETNYAFSPQIAGNGFGNSVIQTGTGKTVLSGDAQDIGAIRVFGGLLEFTENVSNTSGKTTEIWGDGGTLRISSGAQVALDLTNRPSVIESGSRFEVSGAGTVFSGNLGGSAYLDINGQLEVRDGATFSTQGGRLSSGYLYVGDGNVEHMGRLYLTSADLNGGSVRANEIVQQGSGTVTIYGGSVLESGTYEQIDGTLDVKNGATIDIAGRMELGNGGAGALNMDGGEMHVQSLEMGAGQNGSMSAQISGGNIVTSAIGHVRLGTGSLTMTGGTISSYSGYIDSIYGTSNATIENGAAWNTTMGITVGDGGTGALEILGGTVTATGTVGSHYIGSGNNGSGHVLVANGGSLTSNLYVVVGGIGSGELEVRDGLVQTQTVILGDSATGNGTLRTGPQADLAVNGIWEGSGEGKVFLDGGRIEATGHQQNFISYFEEGDIELVQNAVFIDTKEFEIGIDAPLGGAGGIVKLGTGQLRLSGNNTYAGGTTINAGTVIAGHNNALGTGAVTLAGGTLLLDYGVMLSNAVDLAGGEYVRQISAGSNLSGLLNVTSSVGGNGPVAAQTLAGQISQDATVEVSVSASGGLPAPVFQLSGLPQIGPELGQTDVFVLQISFSDSGPGTFLAWLNGSNEWVNAIEGNFGNNPAFTDAPFSFSFAAFQSIHPSLTLDQSLGAWGSYSEGGQRYVWAVLNHNSEFTAIPEPSTCVLLTLGLGALCLVRRRRRVDH